MIKLDYSLQSPEERKALVEKILEENPNPDSQYLERMADYLILCMEKQEKKERNLLTENRMSTIGKRETSFEGLVSQLENGEDGIYNLVSNDKNIIFKPKIGITKEDLEDIPELRQLREAIKIWEAKSKTAEGKDAYIIKRTMIEMRKDQYIIKSAYRHPVVPNKITRSTHHAVLDDDYSIDENGVLSAFGVSLAIPDVCSAILCNYSKLKEDSEGNFDGDTWFLMETFDKIADIALKPYPLYERLVECKIDGMQNSQIQNILQLEFGVKHSLEYISSLWRNKIPKLIASAAEDMILNSHYLNVEKGKYKRCSRCGQIKLAHNKYFSKNNTSKDGFYSICKECRSKKFFEAKDKRN